MALVARCREAGEHCPSGARGKSWDTLGLHRRQESPIAGEHLVAAVARQHHRHVSAREPGNEVHRHRRGVAEWPVMVPDERVDEIDRFRSDAELRVFGVEPLRREAGIRRLVVGRVAFEPDAEGLHPLRHQTAHQPDDDGRVDAAAEKCTERHVTDKAAFDGPRGLFADGGDGISVGHWLHI